MPVSILNLAAAKAILDREDVDMEPEEKNRTAALAALIPGPMGLIIPLAAVRNRREEEEEPEEPEEPKDGEVVARLESIEQSLRTRQEMDVRLSQRLDALDKRLADHLKSLPEPPKTGLKTST